MGDTTIMGRKISGAFKSIAMYAAISICLVVGVAFMDMTREKWTAMWWLQKTGWGLLLSGNTLNTIKAATSRSTRKPEA